MKGPDRQRVHRFETLCEPCRVDVFRFALWLSRSRPVAEEVVQETFLRAWRSLDSLKDGESARSWLLTIARREHARLYERKRHPTVNIDELASVESNSLAETHDRDPDEVNDVRQALADPQVLARDMIVEVEHPAFGPLREVRSPVRTEGEIRQPTRAPRLGEHTDVILRDILGYGEGTIARLRAAGVIG